MDPARGSRLGGIAWPLVMAGGLLAPIGAHGADTGAAAAKAQVCAACHGLGGNSVDPAVPSIAGQQKQFIAMQLVMFREGHRKSPQMTPVAADMPNATINELAGYFSAQKPQSPTRRTDPARAAAAQRLTAQHHCISCHGPDLLGQQHVPKLAGQHFEYLRDTLRSFKAGSRFDMDGQMTSATQALSEGDIELLADYLAGLR